MIGASSGPDSRKGCGPFSLEAKSLQTRQEKRPAEAGKWRTPRPGTDTVGMTDAARRMGRMNEAADNRYLAPSEVAHLLNVSMSSVYRACEEGTLPHVQLRPNGACESPPRRCDQRAGWARRDDEHRNRRGRPSTSSAPAPAEERGSPGTAVQHSQQPPTGLPHGGGHPLLHRQGSSARQGAVAGRATTMREGEVQEGVGLLVAALDDSSGSALHGKERFRPGRSRGGARAQWFPPRRASRQTPIRGAIRRVSVIQAMEVVA